MARPCFARSSIWGPRIFVVIASLLSIGALVVELHGQEWSRSTQDGVTIDLGLYALTLSGTLANGITPQASIPYTCEATTGAIADLCAQRDSLCTLLAISSIISVTIPFMLILEYRRILFGSKFRYVLASLFILLALTQIAAVVLWSRIESADWQAFIVVVPSVSFAPYIGMGVAILNSILPAAVGIPATLLISQAITHDKFIILN